jgi:formate dehydrogenase (NADP+) beta subunit
MSRRSPPHDTTPRGWAWNLRTSATRSTTTASWTASGRAPRTPNVPEYIRLIAQGRYTEAYLLNRESNVFPGILGRTCDRPCEPACRRTRVDGKAGGHLPAEARGGRPARRRREHLLPGAAGEERPPHRAGGRGAGVAHGVQRPDAAGLRVHGVREAGPPGGLMRINIPAFRLPPRVLDEEIDYDRRHGRRGPLRHPRRQHEGAAGGGFDAVFVGSGAPKGKELDLPGRHDDPRTSSSASSGWRASTSATWTSDRPERCSSSAWATRRWTAAARRKRLGATDVKVIARKTRKYFKASPGSSRTPRRRASRSWRTCSRCVSSYEDGRSSAWSSTSFSLAGDRREAEVRR